MPKKKTTDTSGVHLWLILLKAYHPIARHATASIRRTGLGDSDFRVLEALLHKGPLPINTIGPKVWLTPGSISVAIDRLEAKKLVSRHYDPADRRICKIALTAKGRTLITKGFHHHAAEMDHLVSTLTPRERQTLQTLLKKLGHHAQSQLS